MADKKYTIKTACPQCGCSRAQVLSAAEMKEKYGEVPNFEMECHECMEKYMTETKSACPEWDAACRMQD